MRHALLHVLAVVIVQHSVALPYGESIPVGMEKAFAEQVRTLRRIAIPNPAMQAQIDRLAAKLGLDQREVTKRRPVIACVRLSKAFSKCSSCGA